MHHKSGRRTSWLHDCLCRRLALLCLVIVYFILYCSHHRFCFQLTLSSLLPSMHTVFISLWVEYCNPDLMQLLILHACRLHGSEREGIVILGARITRYTLARYHRGGHDLDSSYECWASSSRRRTEEAIDREIRLMLNDWYGRRFVGQHMPLGT